jgi:hypothetical protein
MLCNLLGKPLKSDEVLEVLRDFDLVITYNVDVLRENSADSYTASSPDCGFDLKFDEKQILETIFCYIDTRRERRPVDPSLVGAPLYGTIEEAKAAASASGTLTVSRDGIHAFDRTVSFVRFDHTTHSCHYEYQDDKLAMVTLMIPKAVPGARVA